jgi:hypothetical protein
VGTKVHSFRDCSGHSLWIPVQSLGFAACKPCGRLDGYHRENSHVKLLLPAPFVRCTLASLLEVDAESASIRSLLRSAAFATNSSQQPQAVGLHHLSHRADIMGLDEEYKTFLRRPLIRWRARRFAGTKGERIRLDQYRTEPKSATA